MSQTIQVGRWAVQPDVERTLEAHSKLTASGARECGCAGCLNFDALRPQLLEGPLGRILAQLGISPPWEVEVFEMGRLPSGLHEYGGWFHFVGAIVSGSAAWRSSCALGGGSILLQSAYLPVPRISPSGRIETTPIRLADFEPLSPTLSIGLQTEVALVRPPFEGLPLVQLDISVQLPWVSDAEEPE